MRADHPQSPTALFALAAYYLSQWGRQRGWRLVRPAEALARALAQAELVRQCRVGLDPGARQWAADVLLRLGEEESGRTSQTAAPAHAKHAAAAVRHLAALRQLCELAHRFSCNEFREVLMAEIAAVQDAPADAGARHASPRPSTSLGAPLSQPVGRGVRGEGSPEYVGARHASPLPPWGSACLLVRSELLTQLLTGTDEKLRLRSARFLLRHTRAMIKRPRGYEPPPVRREEDQGRRAYDVGARFPRPVSGVAVPGLSAEGGATPPLQPAAASSERAPP